MSDARFILIQLPAQTQVAPRKIEPILNKAFDWIEVSPNTWVVWTSSSPERWFQRLQTAFGRETRSFICLIDVKERHGRMPKSFWQFLDKDRERNTL